MRKHSLLALSVATAIMAPSAADAACFTKYAKATADTVANTKWYVLETIVQAVDWVAWPGFVANGKPTGYVIKNESYSCKPNGSMFTCNGKATLCTAK